jgi:putative serine protease PepD
VIRGPRHLWRGDWRSDSATAREDAGRERLQLRKVAATEARRAQEPESAPRPQYWMRRGIAGALVLSMLALAAIATVLVVDRTGSDRSSDSEKAATSRGGRTTTGAIYEAASPAVVSIRADGRSGTGFVIDGDGTIVTNSHVVASSQRVAVRFGADSNSALAEVLGTDPSSDLAVVSIDRDDVPASVKPLQLADSNTVRVGDVAIAIGNPFGLDRTATEGIVSGLGREIQAPNGFSISSAIQTDAPINPGNSGGPLLNDAGEVIGVNSQIRTAGAAGNVGVGFAVPSNTVRQVVPVLVRGDTIKRAYLGLQTSPASPSSQRGAQVQSVVPNGPADRAGINSGDVITSVDGQPVREPSDVADAIADDRPGARVEVQVRRDGSIVTLAATLGTRPDSTP